MPRRRGWGGWWSCSRPWTASQRVSPPPAPPRDRAWVEVRTAALRRNLDSLGEAAGPDIRLIPMVKADGYGLGVERIVEALRPARPFGWGVATIAEGLELRRLDVRAPVMICAPVPPADLARAVDAALVPSISDLDSLAALRDLARRAPAAPIPFQLEVDTGMGRAGLPPAVAASALAPPAPRHPSPPPPHHPSPPGLRLFGVFTHLHSADQPDLSSAREQIARFDHFISGLRRAGALPPDALVHCANSAGALRLASRTANAARPGLHLYGAHVGDPRRRAEPVVAVRARVLLVRDVPPGATLGYGGTYTARGRERWASVGIGYADGLPRALGNRGSAILHGRRVPIVGRISMDTTVVRVSRDPEGADARDARTAQDARAARTARDAPDARAAAHRPPPAPGPGDVVTFVGRDGGLEVPLEEVAELAGTIPYEILTGLSRRLPRVSV